MGRYFKELRQPRNWDEIPLFFDLSMAAVITGYDYEYLAKLARKGEFPAFKIGERVWTVDKEDLKDFIQSRKEKCR